MLVSQADRPGRAGCRRADARRQEQEPGGWNRFSFEAPDLPAAVRDLRSSGARFRSDVVTGTGGRQILVEDPSGNPVELFEPVLPEARLSPPRPAPGSPGS
ncbi:MAG: VOC family protein [Streptosporangiaceae bacterium]